VPETTAEDLFRDAVESPRRPRVRRRRRYATGVLWLVAVLSLAGLAVLGAVVAVRQGWTLAPADVPLGPPFAELTPDELCTAYQEHARRQEEERNQARPSSPCKYADKILLIRGHLRGVVRRRDDGGFNVLLMDKTTVPHAVACMFAASDGPRLAALAMDRPLRIKGVCRGLFKGSNDAVTIIVLDHCSLVEPPQTGPEKEDKEPDPQSVSALKEYQFGEEFRVDDLLVTVVEVLNEGPFVGKYNGSFSPFNATLVHIRIKNTSGGKIAEWAGWQGKGEIEDEYGNKFKPRNLSGWSWLPDNTPDGWDGDFSTRIFPDKTYDNAAYYESIPATSKQGVVRLPLNGQIVKFRGRLGKKEALDHAKALAAKGGQVLEATNLVKAIANGSKTLKTDYPRGCTIRVTGSVYLKGNNRSDLVRSLGAYMIWLKCKDGSEAVCSTDDRELYNRVVSERGVLNSPVPEKPAVGSVITMQGTLDNDNFAGDKIQLRISKATEIGGPKAADEPKVER
jgi:hypothetical protein